MVILLMMLFGISLPDSVVMMLVNILRLVGVKLLDFIRFVVWVRLLRMSVVSLTVCLFIRDKCSHFDFA